MSSVGFLMCIVRHDISRLLRVSRRLGERRLCLQPRFVHSLQYSQPDSKTTGHRVVTELLRPCNNINVLTRSYAKSKDRKKEKGKQKVTVDDTYLAGLLPIDNVKQQMQRSVDHLKTEFVQNLSLRSTSGAIENLRVKFEGGDHTIQEIGQIARKDSKTVIINLSAFPQALPAVLQALQKSGMNLNVQQDGTTLFIPVPRVTVEHREQLAKNAKTLFVKCRDTVRDIQNKQVKALKDKDSIAKDDIFNVQQQLTALADSYISEADAMLQTKLKELLGKQ